MLKINTRRTYKQVANSSFDAVILERALERDFENLGFLFEKKNNEFELPAGYIGAEGAIHGLKHVLCSLPNLCGVYTECMGIVGIQFQEHCGMLTFKVKENRIKDIFQTILVCVEPAVEVVEAPVDEGAIILSRYKRLS